MSTYIIFQSLLYKNRTKFDVLILTFVYIDLDPDLDIDRRCRKIGFVTTWYTTANVVVYGVQNDPYYTSSLS